MSLECARTHNALALAVSAEGAIKLRAQILLCVCDARAAPARIYNNAQAKHESGPFIQQPSAVLSHIFGDNTGKQPCARVLCAFLVWRGEHFEIISSSCLWPRRLDKNNFLSACLGRFGFISPSRLIT